MIAVCLQNVHFTKHLSEHRNFSYHYLLYGTNKSGVYSRQPPCSTDCPLCHDLWLHQCMALFPVGVVMVALDRTVFGEVYLQNF